MSKFYGSLEFTFKIASDEDGIVKYDGYSEKWTLNGIQSEMVQKLNRQAYHEILSIIPVKVAEAQAAKEAKEKAEQEARAEAQRIAAEKFRAEVESLIPAGYSITNIWQDSFYMGKNNVSATVAANSSRSSRPWRISTPDYKHANYISLEKAINAAVKSIEEKIEAEISKVNAENAYKQKTQDFTNNLAKLGIKVFTRNDGYYSGPRRTHWVTTPSRQANVTIAGNPNEGERIEIIGTIGEDNTGNPIIRNAKITANMTPEQFKKIADCLKSLDIIKSY